MTPRNPDLPNSPEALFRFVVVSDVLTRVAQGQLRADAVRAVAAQAWQTPGGQLRRVSARTIYRWVRAYAQRGVDGLEPARRTRTTSSVVLPTALLSFLEDQKRRDPLASIPEIIDRARLLGVIEPHDKIDRTTVWRAGQRMGLAVGKRKTARNRDMRRHRVPHRMQLMLCDGKHFRAGIERLRRVALFYLDNACRYGLHVVVGTSENPRLFLRGFFEAVGRHGLMDVVYLDGGAGFIAHDVARVLGKLGVLVIHGEARYPEAHGSIERFNQTAKHLVLRSLDRSPTVDPDCGALENRLQHWLREVYNHRPHGTLDGQTPWQRWDADTRSLRMPEDRASLHRRFLVEDRRNVSLDNVIAFEGTDYEVPRGHAGTRIRVYRHVLDETVHVVHDGQLVRVHPVNLAANAASGRARPGGAAGDEGTSPLPPTAAELAWRRDCGPIVGPDGGFSDDTKE